MPTCWVGTSISGELPILVCIPLAITVLVNGTAWGSDGLVLGCSGLIKKNLARLNIRSLCLWNKCLDDDCKYYETMLLKCLCKLLQYFCQEFFSQQVEGFRFVTILCKYHAGSAFCHSQFWTELYNINGSMQRMGAMGAGLLNHLDLTVSKQLTSGNS